MITIKNTISILQLLPQDKAVALENILILQKRRERNQKKRQRQRERRRVQKQTA